MKIIHPNSTFGACYFLFLNFSLLRLPLLPRNRHRCLVLLPLLPRPRHLRVLLLLLRLPLHCFHSVHHLSSDSLHSMQKHLLLHSRFGFFVPWFELSSLIIVLHLVGPALAGQSLARTSGHGSRWGSGHSTLGERGRGAKDTPTSKRQTAPRFSIFWNIYNLITISHGQQFYHWVLALTKLDWNVAS